jgi:hypothetical protein
MMKRRTRDEWQALFAEQAASSFSAQQFCEQHGICPKYFSLRKQQLQSPVTDTSAFIRVQKAAPMAMLDSTATVRLRHGRSEVELHAVSPEWLSRLLVALA